MRLLSVTSQVQYQGTLNNSAEWSDGKQVAEIIQSQTFTCRFKILMLYSQINSQNEHACTRKSSFQDDRAFHKYQVFRAHFVGTKCRMLHFRSSDKHHTTDRYAQTAYQVKNFHQISQLQFSLSDMCVYCITGESI